MEVQTNEQAATSAQAADAETGKNGAIASENASLGKFKDTGALLNAYKSLEAEFTRRCRRLSELEGRLKEDNKDLTLNEKTLMKEEVVNERENENEIEIEKNSQSGKDFALTKNGGERQAKIAKADATFANDNLRNENYESTEKKKVDGMNERQKGWYENGDFQTEAKFVTAGSYRQPNIMKPKSLKEAGKLVLENFKNFNKGE